MSETSYERYKRALKEIAAGAIDSEGIAREALRSRWPKPADPVKRAAANAHADAMRKKRDEDARLCAELYNKWLIAERPAISTFAKEHGISRSQMLRRLMRAERGTPYGSRRLWWGRRPKNGYPTQAEVRARDGW